MTHKAPLSVLLLSSGRVPSSPHTCDDRSAADPATVRGMAAESATQGDICADAPLPTQSARSPAYSRSAFSLLTEERKLFDPIAFV